MKLARPLVLASASPRRREILTRLGLSFEVRPADIDESQLVGEDPVAYVARLSEQKARAALAQDPDAAYIGADTTVVVDGELLGKPADAVESRAMVAQLRNRWHQVHTSVSVVLAHEALTKVVTTEVRFRDFSDATLDGYVASGEGMDKAGSYGIQDLGAGLVDEVRGSYSNVVGLPAAQTLELLERTGVLASWP